MLNPIYKLGSWTILLALLLRPSTGLHAAHPSKNSNPPIFAQRGYYLLPCRAPTLGLSAWKDSIDCFAEDEINVLVLWMGGGFRSKKFPITWKYNAEHENVKQDFFGEVIDYAHSKGIKVVLGFTPFGYDGVNQFTLEQTTLRATPAPNQKTNAFGLPTELAGIHCWGYNLCPAKAESQKLMREYIREMYFDFYPQADGLFIESSDYAICHCQDCREKFFDHELNFIRDISDDVWHTKPTATIIVYPHYFMGKKVPIFNYVPSKQKFDPRWTVFFTNHSAHPDDDLIVQAKSSWLWTEAPALRGPAEIQRGAQQAQARHCTGFVPSLEAMSFVATQPEEGKAWQVGKRQVPFGFGWLKPGQSPYRELPIRMNRIAYREYCRNPDLSTESLDQVYEREFLGGKADPQWIADARFVQQIFATDRSWTLTSPLVNIDRVKGEGMLPKRAAEFRQQLARLREISIRYAGAEGESAAGELHRIASWVVAQWGGENEKLLASKE